MELQNFKNLIASRALIRFTKQVDECEAYAEEGMLARLEKFGKLDQDGSLSFYVNFAGLEDANKSLESSTYYDKNGQPTLTAREAGYYHDIESYWAGNVTELDKLFTVVDPSMQMLLDAYNDEKNEGETYQDWLISQALPMKSVLDLHRQELVFYDCEPRDVIRETLSFLRRTQGVGWIYVVAEGESYKVTAKDKLSELLPAWEDKKLKELSPKI